MHRFYLPPEECKGTDLYLTGREAHHALHVLRLRHGDRVAVLDGAGQQILGDIMEHDRDKVRVTVAQREQAPLPLYRITLLQALPKGKLIESIIQKATELGVSRVVPLLSERVVAQFGSKEGALKSAKWQLIAVEAIKQCGAVWLPQVEVPMTPAQFIARGEHFDLPFIASLHDDRKHPREYLRVFHAQHGCQPKSVCVWIGPEGDFTVPEIEAVKSVGGLPITLGNLVLRAETAALYSLSVLNYELQSPLA